MPTDRESGQSVTSSNGNDVPPERGRLDHGFKPDTSGHRVVGSQFVRGGGALSLYLGGSQGLEVPQPDRWVAGTIRCVECGGIMVRNGASYRCHNCGADSGCS